MADLKRRVEGVQQAKHSNQSKNYDYPFIMNLPVHNDCVGHIIGKQGITLKGIRDRSGANVYIPHEADAENPLQRTLVIGGSTNAFVEAAHREIFETLQAKENSLSYSPSAVPATVCTMIVPDDKVGRIIGKKAAPKMNCRGSTA